MPVSLVVVFVSVAALWLFGHQIVKHRFTLLKAALPEKYDSAFAAPTADADPLPLMALCVDLMRKEHCTVPFDALSTQEQKTVLHAHAIEALPYLISRYAALWLSRSSRVIIFQLRQVSVSRPHKPQQYFGAIKHQQQLRSAAKD